MTINIWRLRKCSLFDYKFVIHPHNTIRDEAGRTNLNAELMLKLN